MNKRHIERRISALSGTEASPVNTRHTKRRISALVGTEASPVNKGHTERGISALVRIADRQKRCGITVNYGRVVITTDCDTTPSRSQR